MKVIDFKESKAEKNGEVTPKKLAKDLLLAIEKGEVKNLVYVALDKNNQILLGCNDMPQTEAIGLLECGKQIIINDMYD